MLKTITKFLDYEIHHCTNGDGIVPIKNKPYNHLGNYSNDDEAQIACILYFMLARPEKFATHIFHYTIGIATMHEYFAFEEVLKKENIKMPKEIKIFHPENNCLIGYKGKEFGKLIRSTFRSK